MLSVDETSPEQQAESPKSVNPLLVIHRLLRGKYIWAIPSAIIVGLICALACRSVVKPSYSSTGSIRIRPTLPRALVDTEENGELPMYQQYVDMQATLLTSERVADLAAQDPDWVALAGPPSPDSAGLLLSNIKVMHEGELINVVYTGRFRDATQVAVHALISAYLKLYSETEEAAKDDHVKLLEHIKANDSARLAELNRESAAFANKYGSTSLESLVEFKMLELSEMRKNLRQMDAALAALQSGGDASTQPASLEDNSAEVWALSDRTMANLLDQKLQTQATLSSNRQVLGENNPTLRANEFALQTINGQIKDRAAFLAKNTPASARGAGVAGVDGLPALQKQRAALVAEIANDDAELSELGKSNVALKAITTEQTTLQQQLADTSRSLEELQSENVARGRVDVLSFGDRPQLQVSKRSLAAGGGGMIGALGTLGCFALLGLRNQKLHQISDVQPAAITSGELTILGALPVIAERPVAYNEDVAYAIHKIRAHLQLAAERKDQRVLAMTSPLSGDGKTSMVVALGMSFAGSGSRTLLVDGDIVGGGLTARFDVKVQPDILKLIRRHTTLSEGELAHAWEVCRSKRTDLLDVLVNLRLLDQDAATQLEKLHAEARVGILEALGGEKLGDCVAMTRWPNLSVLPRGAATAEDVSRISPKGFRSLLQQARAAYDIVLVDTGPISGSIEATLTMSEADGTILVVSRGGSASDVRKAVNEVQAAGGVMLGVIFNRAKAKDLQISGFSSSVRSQAQFPSKTPTDGVTGAVASALVRSSRGNDWERRS